MKKIWMHAKANIRKTKSASMTLIILFIIAAFLLNTGLLVVLNYGNYFNEVKKELAASDAYYMIPDKLYTEEVKSYMAENKYIQKMENHDTMLITSKIQYKDKKESFHILFQNMEEERTISKWKFVGEHLPAEEMSVYLPDIFKATGGYELNDQIKLTYKDQETGRNKNLIFTIKGYTEDVFFSSTSMGFLGFYLPEKTYEEVGEILGNNQLDANILVSNLDKMSHVPTVENGIRDIAKLNSAALIGGSDEELIVAIDVELTELARCMMANMVSVMMVIFAMIIVVVCLLVVRFRIVNSIEEDVMKIGSLKSVGYTSRQIISTVLLQFLLISGIGSLIGIALSYPAIPAVSTVFEQQSGLKWEQGFDGKISFMALIILVLIVIGTTLIATRKIRNLSPVKGLRGELSTHEYKRNHLALEKTRGNLSFLLAMKSIVQNMKQNVMIGFILIVVTFAGTFGVIMYYNTAIDTKAFAEVPGMEVCNAIAVLNPEKDQTETIKTIKEMKSVEKAQYLDEIKGKVEGTEATIFVMDDYSKRETVLTYEGRYPEKKGEITLAGILAERLNKKLGDQVTLKIGDQEKNFKVVGLSNGSNMGGISASTLKEDIKELNPKYKQQSLYIYLKEGTSAAGFNKDLEKKIEKDILMGTVNFDKEMEAGMASYQNIVAAMGLSMLIITLLVVTLVLYFIISSSIIRKKRELGIFKAIGYTTFQLMNQISISFTAPIILGVGTGAILGALYTNPLMSVSMKSMGIMKAGFIVNTQWIVGFGIATILFSYLLSLLITWKIRKISAYALVTE